MDISLTTKQQTTIKKISQIPSLKVELYEHQLVSIYNMEELESNNFICNDSNTTKETKIGINSDIAGYGKTLSMIGLIVRDKMEWDLDVPYVFETVSCEAKGRIKIHNIIRKDRIGTTLILVPINIVFQWVNELEKSSLKFVTLTSKKDLDDHINIEEYDVVLIIPTLVNRLIRIYSKFAWKRFIFDEPSHVKFHLDEIYAGFYWFMTWCPSNIYTQYKNRNYSIGFMKDLFAVTNDFANLIKDIEVKNDDNFVKSSYKIPETLHFHYYCEEELSSLHKFEIPSISKMIMLGDIRNAILSVGGSITSNVKDVVKSNKLQELNNCIAKLEYNRLRGNNVEQMSHWESQKEHLLIQMNEIDLRFDNVLDKNCLICFSKLTKPILESNCQNIFCGECFLRWFQIKGTCPVCRVKVLPKSLTYVEEGDQDYFVNESNKRLTKIKQTIEIIKKNPKSKFLIYNEKNNNQLISSFFEDDLKYLLLKGSCKTREKILDVFRSENSNINVILFNSLTEIYGLNLIEVTDIILFHEITNSNEAQLISIANRLGRKSNLKIHNLHISVDVDSTY